MSYAVALANAPIAHANATMMAKAPEFMAGPGSSNGAS
jgi:hypothetical protein